MEREVRDWLVSLQGQVDEARRRVDGLDRGAKMEARDRSEIGRSVGELIQRIDELEARDSRRQGLADCVGRLVGRIEALEKRGVAARVNPTVDEYLAHVSKKKFDLDNPTCGTCRFYSAGPTEKHLGDCRRNPWTYEKFCHNWCGEHTPRE